jgi:hypothetical protein
MRLLIRIGEATLAMFVLFMTLPLLLLVAAAIHFMAGSPILDRAPTTVCGHDVSSLYRFNFKAPGIPRVISAWVYQYSLDELPIFGTSCAVIFDSRKPGIEL